MTQNDDRTLFYARGANGYGIATTWHGAIAHALVNCTQPVRLRNIVVHQTSANARIDGYDGTLESPSEITPIHDGTLDVESTLEAADEMLTLAERILDRMQWTEEVEAVPGLGIKIEKIAADIGKASSAILDLMPE